MRERCSFSYRYEEDTCINENILRLIDTQIIADGKIFMATEIGGLFKRRADR